MSAYHVFPTNDLQGHRTDDAEGLCECQPEVQWIDPETELPWAIGEGPVIVHNAFDLREMFEPDGPWSG